MASQHPSKSSARSGATMVILPAEPGRKHKHLAIITHRGGGWYDVACMGEARRCREGVCKHTANMRWADSARTIRQVPREGVDSGAQIGDPGERQLPGSGHREDDSQ